MKGADRRARCGHDWKRQQSDWLVGGLIGGTSRVWHYLVAGVCLIIGLQMLGVIRLPEVGWLARVRERVRLRGVPGAPLLAAILLWIASTTLSEMR